MADTLILTTQGRQAISNAMATGTQVFPKTFKFITPILTINENYTASTINQSDIWYSADITEYDIDSTYQTVSFNCIVEANLATAKTGTVGLYFEDGTLFAIASLSSQLPAGTRQGVYLRINMDSSQAAFNFNFISANDYLHNTDSIYIGTTEVSLNRASGIMLLNGVVTNEPLNTIASATTTSINGVDAKTIVVTGTTTITSFGTAPVGATRNLIFDGILTLTHNATTLILPTGANITTAAGDTATFVYNGTGWKCIDYMRADGTALKGGVEFASQSEVNEGTVTNKAIAPNTLRTLMLSTGEIGSISLLCKKTANTTIALGETLAGSSLAYTGLGVYNSGTASYSYNVGLTASLSGTWKAIGATQFAQANVYPAVLFIRIS